MKRLPTVRPSPRALPGILVPARVSVTVERAFNADCEAMEQSLRESEARYHLPADNVADMIVCTRPDRTRSYVSPASRRLLGYEPAELVDRDFAMSIHPEDRQRVKTEYEQFLMRGGGGVHTYRLRRKDGSYVWVDASVGIAMSPWDGMLPDDLHAHAHAHEVLTCAEAEGGEAYREFQPPMAVHRQARLDTEADLRQALADKAFRVFYQPVASLTSNTIVGFEALVRWQHPVRGLVLPDAFIPLAEDSGLIVPLGTRVLRQACRDAAHWPAQIRVSVNVSSIQFMSATFVDTVCSALQDSGLPARRLDLEITESVLLRESPGTVAVLKELRRLGIGISLDDFGTGFASLGYLRSFPFDRIKIDRSFVSDLLERAESEAIVRAVIGIGETLGIATVAEGVEMRGQLQRLRAHGCSEAQGYLFSKARPADEVAAMLAAFDAPRRDANSLAFS